MVALLVALVMNATNLFEPLTVDDVCHHYYAEQVARHPSAPFEFDIVWHQKPVAAWTVMVAPVNSYYWAPGILLSDHVPADWQAMVWHLWFLPVQWLFCYSLLLLLRRWLRRGAALLLCTIALGPAVLPGLNLMLEVPMLSLGLSSLVAVQRAFDRRSVAWAVFAGLLWGLAFQTKYSAMGLFPPWFLLAYVRWRWREWAIGLATAAAVAFGIEGLISLSHGGGSYFMQQLEYTQLRSGSQLLKGMFQHVGALSIPAALLGLVGLGARRWLFVVVIGVYLVGYVMVASFHDLNHGLFDGAPDSIAHVTMAATTWGVLTVVFWRLLSTGLRGLRGIRLSGGRAMRVFLVLWFLSEIVSSFVVSPFPAARRVLMVVVAATVAAGWLAVRRRGSGGAVRAIAIGAVGLGLLYEGVDHVEGHAWVDAARGAVSYVREHDPQAKVYFTGGWGFEFYAPLAGMQPFLLGETQLEKGDYVACGSIDGIEAEWFEPDSRLEEVTDLEFGVDWIPLSTQLAYYSGQRSLAGQTGPRFLVRVLRAKQRLHASDLKVRPDPYH